MNTDMSFLQRLFTNVIVFLIFLSPSLIAAQGKHQFTLGKSEFLLDGKPLQVISGELHPARIPREYWRHRIQMTKAMGCNTVALYVFWNYHETSEGVFDFKTGNRDIAAFIRLCQEEKMWVILRPGPYVCAEWDFGGIPDYLLKYPDIKVRCMDPRYMNAVNRYIDRFAKEVVPLQCINGGPILMVQVENEYGSYGNDREYMESIRKTWTAAGIRIPFYTSDGPTAYMLEAGTLPGAAIGLDSGSDSAAFAQAYRHNPNVPAFSGETYPGWLTHWGEKWQRPDTNGLKKEVGFLLDHHKSFNFYVIHGGSNFGFTAGANAGNAVQYQPDITSYDYDAPINEQGRPTAKYQMLRRMIMEKVSYPVPAIPEPIPAMEIPPITLKKTFNLFNNQVPVLRSPQPRPFEYYGQNQGLVSYKTKLIGHKSGRLKIWEPHDYALVFLNGVFIDTVFRNGGQWEVMLPKTQTANPELEIIVEGMGHINFGQFIIDRKGITDRVTLNGMTLMNWEVQLFPLDEAFISTLDKNFTGTIPDNLPCNFFEGEFELSGTADTYFDMGNYSKGIVYINGHNLGRYWNVGPQQRLYCPASWLKKGKNKIIVFDLHQLTEQTVTGFRTPE